jgi:hypothetical protein
MAFKTDPVHGGEVYPRDIHRRVSCCWCEEPVREINAIRIEETYWCSSKCYNEDMEAAERIDKEFMR